MSGGWRAAMDRTRRQRVKVELLATLRAALVEGIEPDEVLELLSVAAEPLGAAVASVPGHDQRLQLELERVVQLGGAGHPSGRIPRVRAVAIAEDVLRRFTLEERRP